MSSKPNTYQFERESITILPHNRSENATKIANLNIINTGKRLTGSVRGEVGDQRDESAVGELNVAYN